MRRIKRLNGYIAVAWVAVLSSQSVLADPYFDEQNTQLARYLEDLKSRCKADFSAKIDAASFAKPVAAQEKRRAENLYAHCNQPLRAITEWCADGLGESIGKEIKSYTCKYAEGPSKASLEGTDLVVTTSWSKDGSGWSKAAKIETGNFLRHGEFSANASGVMRDNAARVKDLLLDMPRNCDGYKIDYKIDWKSFVPLINSRLGTDPSHTIWQECYEPLRVLTQRCDNGQSNLVKEQVTSYTCRYDANQKTALSLEKGAYILSTNMEKRKRSWFQDQLGDQLKDGEFSARQTDFIKEQNTDFKRVFSDEYEYKCGPTLKWEIDWKSFKKEIDKRVSKEENTSIYDVCGVPVNRLMDLCADNTKVKKKVKGKIKSFKCVFGGKHKRKLSLKKRQLSYRVDFAAKDAYGFVDRFLVKKHIIKKRPPPKKMSPAELDKIRRVLSGAGSSAQKCKRACSKKCRGARNKSKCKSHCRARCG